jgi:hypothetical protein
MSSVGTAYLNDVLLSNNPHPSDKTRWTPLSHREYDLLAWTMARKREHSLQHPAGRTLTGPYRLTVSAVPSPQTVWHRRGGRATAS